MPIIHPHVKYENYNKSLIVNTGTQVHYNTELLDLLEDEINSNPFITHLDLSKAKFHLDMMTYYEEENYYLISKREEKYYRFFSTVCSKIESLELSDPNNVSFPYELLKNLNPVVTVEKYPIVNFLLNEALGGNAPSQKPPIPLTSNSKLKKLILTHKHLLNGLTDLELTNRLTQTSVNEIEFIDGSYVTRYEKQKRDNVFIWVSTSFYKLNNETEMLTTSHSELQGMEEIPTVSVETSVTSTSSSVPDLEPTPTIMEEMREAESVEELKNEDRKPKRKRDEEGNFAKGTFNPFKADLLNFYGEKIRAEAKKIAEEVKRPGVEKINVISASADKIDEFLKDYSKEISTGENGPNVNHNPEPVRDANTFEKEENIRQGHWTPPKPSISNKEDIKKALLEIFEDALNEEGVSTVRDDVREPKEKVFRHHLFSSTPRNLGGNSCEKSYEPPVTVEKPQHFGTITDAGPKVDRSNLTNYAANTPKPFGLRFLTSLERETIPAIAAQYKERIEKQLKEAKITEGSIVIKVPRKVNGTQIPVRDIGNILFNIYGKQVAFSLSAANAKDDKESHILVVSDINALKTNIVSPKKTM